MLHVPAMRKKRSERRYEISIRRPQSEFDKCTRVQKCVRALKKFIVHLVTCRTLKSVESGNPEKMESPKNIVNKSDEDIAQEKN